MIRVDLARRFIERVSKYTDYNANIMGFDDTKIAGYIGCADLVLSCVFCYDRSVTKNGR